MAKNIVLIGFMGSGKSTVGKGLASDLGWEFLDTDVEIEKMTGFTISDIFKKWGEEGFRIKEKQLIQQLTERKNCVISTGGGTILNLDNREILSGVGHIISLRAPVKTVLERIGEKGDRPLLKKPLAEIEELWKSRQLSYNQADYIVDTVDKDIDEVKEEIINWLRRRDDVRLDSN